MRITINQLDIVEAVKAYVLENVSTDEDATIVVEFKAGRKGSGLTATVLVNEEAEAPKEKKPASTTGAKRGRKPGSKNAPKAVEATPVTEIAEESVKAATPAIFDEPEVEEEAEVEAQPVAPTATKSLFGDLKTPVNSAE